MFARANPISPAETQIHTVVFWGRENLSLRAHVRRLKRLSRPRERLIFAILRIRVLGGRGVVAKGWISNCRPLHIRRVVKFIFVLLWNSFASVTTAKNCQSESKRRDLRAAGGFISFRLALITPLVIIARARAKEFPKCKNAPNAASFSIKMLLAGTSLH